jgi:hypothetical protein
MEKEDAMRLSTIVCLVFELGMGVMFLSGTSWIIDNL